MDAKIFDCHKIAEGTATGESLVSVDDICFYLIAPKSGVVIEKGHALEGQSVASKVLIFPTGKGSSVVQADGLYQLQMHGNAPKAMIIEHADTVLVASAIIMGIPVVDKLPQAFYDTIESGQTVTVDSHNAIVEVVPKL
jgi:predicted aconitase with swiveling domain